MGFGIWQLLVLLAVIIALVGVRMLRMRRVRARPGEDAGAGPRASDGDGPAARER